MSKELEMREIRIKREEGPMELREALLWATEHIKSDIGWMLAEMPEKPVWTPLKAAPAPESLATCTSLMIFGPNAEIRLQKPYAESRGTGRTLLVDAQGESGLERLSSYIMLMGGHLDYAEFFRIDPQTGVLRLEFARYCGVRGD